MIQTIHLRHPLHDAQAEADVVGYWMQNGRNMGLEIAFPDGHRCKLSYREIADLQQETADEAPQGETHV